MSDIPSDMHKSLSENYELGRILVEHIVEKEDFVKSFFYNIAPNNPLKFLDYLFLV